MVSQLAGVMHFGDGVFTALAHAAQSQRTTMGVQLTIQAMKLLGDVGRHLADFVHFDDKPIGEVPLANLPELIDPLLSSRTCFGMVELDEQPVRASSDIAVEWRVRFAAGGNKTFRL